MLEFALQQEGPSAIRYPKASVAEIEPDEHPIELGKAEIIRWGTDGAMLCFGTLLSDCVRASNTLRQQGLNVAVINARFAKPVDREIVERVLNECSFVVTVEEGGSDGRFW